MKLNYLPILLLTLILSAGMFTSASAQNYHCRCAKRGYTVYAPDTAFDRYYNDHYHGYCGECCSRYHHRYYKHGYYRARRYNDYYYNDKYCRDRRYYDHDRRYYDRWDDDKYYYRGGGY